MIKTTSPKKLWDYCFKLKDYIRYNNVHDIYMLHMEVPKTVMYGENSDISKFGELGGYEWIYYRENAFQLTDENILLGRYLVPSIDIGPALTIKTIKKMEKWCIDLLIM